MWNLLLQTTLATYLMEVERSCVTFAFVDACYFRKLLFYPPLVEGRV